MVTLIIAGLTLALGYLVGRSSAPPPPDKQGILDAVAAAADARIDEAKRHGMGQVVENLLDKERQDIEAILKKKLP